MHSSSPPYFFFIQSFARLNLFRILINNDSFYLQSFKKLASISSDRKWNSTYPSDGTEVTSWLIRFRPKTDPTAVITSTKTPMSLSNGWMRLAIRDQGACLMLDRIRVYYLSCPAWQVRSTLIFIYFYYFSCHILTDIHRRSKCNKKKPNLPFHFHSENCVKNSFLSQTFFFKKKKEFTHEIYEINANYFPLHLFAEIPIFKYLHF